MHLTSRERFCLMLANAPARRGEALVFLCGEDTAPRLELLQEIMQIEASIGQTPAVVLTGALHTPPRRYSASELMGDVMTRGVAYDKLILECTATNTREQALAVIPMAIERGWTRLLLLVPSYHLYRAYLTFLAALTEMGQQDTIHLVGVPVRHTPWLQCPEGMDQTRLDLLEQELRKIEEYGAAGHVASYADGIAYLKHWETA